MLQSSSPKRFCIPTVPSNPNPAPQRTLAEPLMLTKGGNRRKRLTAVGTLDLLSTVGVHPLVSAEIRELGVSLQADLTLKRLDRTMDVLMLLQAARGRERLAAVYACVTSGAMML